MRYWPATAVPLAVHVIDSPMARLVCGQETATPWSSATATLERSVLPVLVTTYVHVTVEPTATVGPGAASASWPLVAFSMSIAGAAAAWKVYSTVMVAPASVSNNAATLPPPTAKESAIPAASRVTVPVPV